MAFRWIRSVNTADYRLLDLENENQRTWIEELQELPNLIDPEEYGGCQQTQEEELSEGIEGCQEWCSVVCDEHTEKRKLECEEDSHTAKKRKIEWSSDQDLVPLVLSYIDDAKSLVKCMLVCKVWKYFIQSPWFRKWWRGEKQLWVLVSVANSARFYRWTSSWGLSRFPLETSLLRPQIVTSAGGLVCITSTVGKHVGRFVVGNPLTREWVSLPLLDMERCSTAPEFRMELVNQGAYRIGVNALGESSCHVSYVYDSMKNSWSVTKLHFAAGDEKAKRAFYDLAQGRWRTDVVTDPHVTTGLENDEEGRRHILPHPFLQGYCTWKHNGVEYFASPWGTDRPNSIGLSGFGVWRSEGGKLERVAAAPAGDLINPGMLEDVHDSPLCRLWCNGMGNLVCFATHVRGFRLHPAIPMVVYDLATRTWTALACDFCQCQHVDDLCPLVVNRTDKRGIDDYTAAIVYSPSLLAPYPSPYDIDSGWGVLSDWYHDDCQLEE